VFSRWDVVGAPRVPVGPRGWLPRPTICSCTVAIPGKRIYEPRGSDHMTPTGATARLRRDACCMAEGPSPHPDLYDALGREAPSLLDVAERRPCARFLESRGCSRHGHERQAVTARELLGGLVDELPAPERAQPLAYIEDQLLPLVIAPVEPAAFVLACIRAAWASHGLRNWPRATMATYDDHAASAAPRARARAARRRARRTPGYACGPRLNSSSLGLSRVVSITAACASGRCR
jgi:hypothetical protein